jgi:UDP-glucose 4-epimerase
MLRILIVGGAGYIGSHMIQYLHSLGSQITVIDNLSSGFRNAVLYGTFYEGSVADGNLLDAVLSSQKFDAVMHFAAHIQVGESISSPIKYYQNNAVNTLYLLQKMVEHNVNNFIFSSTAAIFGEPQYVPIDETHPKAPINPYGRSKLIVEQALEDFGMAYGLKSVSLRYFNAAGADPGCQLGERHNPETHLVPLVLQVASGRRANVTIFGNDYDTPDGTCIRDYVHVVDLCDAHWRAIGYLRSGGISDGFNLGNGNGFSVGHVIEVARSITGKTIPTLIGPKRSGDPARLVADSTKARKTLGWTPRYPELRTIIEHAWLWEKKLATQK